jgi:hypothetical protein
MGQVDARLGDELQPALRLRLEPAIGEKRLPRRPSEPSQVAQQLFEATRRSKISRSTLAGVKIAPVALVAGLAERANEVAHVTRPVEGLIEIDGEIEVGVRTSRAGGEGTKHQSEADLGPSFQAPPQMSDPLVEQR